MRFCARKWMCGESPCHLGYHGYLLNPSIENRNEVGILRTVTCCLVMQGPDAPPTQSSLAPDNSDVIGAIRKGQSWNSVERARIVSRCLCFLTCSQRKQSYLIYLCARPLIRAVKIWTHWRIFIKFDMSIKHNTSQFYPIFIPVNFISLGKGSSNMATVRTSYAVEPLAQLHVRSWNFVRWQIFK
jgi:hypothetical protein